jgi:iron complex outermembrane receptor protein
MAHHNFIPALLALAAASCVGTSGAQTVTERVLVTGRSLPQLAGFGSQTLARSPLQASVIGTETLAGAGTLTLAGLSAFDAGITDAYSSEGYWSQFSVRGFILDPRSNYRRDGLPINAETALLLANKERVEVLKGISGTQAGISAPGGLINLVTKRPTNAVRSVQLAAVEGGSVVAGVDLGDRFGAQRQFGLRLNVEAAQLRPQTRDTDGSRRIWALAGDWQLTPDSRVEAEVESSHQSQPSVAGFSLRGNTLPDAGKVDPRININSQPWRQPVELDGDTASLRWRQRLSADWQFSAHGMAQRLVSDDRMAFPFGCYDVAADIYYADRYCPDGSVDIYDFRSENERRRSDALDLQFAGSLRTGGVVHELSSGLLWTRHAARFQRQAFNYAGAGRDDASVIVPAAPELTDENTDRDERSTEFYLRDAMQIGDAWSLWAGLRHVRLGRASVRTDGSRAIHYAQSFTTPWLGLGRQLSPATFVYASWGQGIETDVAPNRARYVNAGQPLPALKSRQVELGVKHSAAPLEAGLSTFVITRPLAADIGDCDVDGSCTRRIDGEARHRGLEASVGSRWGAWQGSASAMWLHAERRGAGDPALNGLRPSNVPEQTLKAQIGYTLPTLPGLQLQARLVHEGGRIVLPDNSIAAPGWTRADLGLRWALTAAGRQTVFRLGVDNVTDAHAWRETPYQFGHAYLFPLAPRSWWASVTIEIL